MTLKVKFFSALPIPFPFRVDDSLGYESSLTTVAQAWSNHPRTVPVQTLQSLVQVNVNAVPETTLQ